MTRATVTSQEINISQHTRERNLCGPFCGACVLGERRVTLAPRAIWYGLVVGGYCSNVRGRKSLVFLSANIAVRRDIEARVHARSSWTLTTLQFYRISVVFSNAMGFPKIFRLEAERG